MYKKKCKRVQPLNAPSAELRQTCLVAVLLVHPQKALHGNSRLQKPMLDLKNNVDILKVKNAFFTLQQIHHLVKHFLQIELNSIQLKSNRYMSIHGVHQCKLFSYKQLFVNSAEFYSLPYLTVFFTQSTFLLFQKQAHHL